MPQGENREFNKGEIGMEMGNFDEVAKRDFRRAVSALTMGIESGNVTDVASMIRELKRMIEKTDRPGDKDFADKSGQYDQNAATAAREKWIDKWEEYWR